MKLDAALALRPIAVLRAAGGRSQLRCYATASTPVFTVECWLHSGERIEDDADPEDVRLTVQSADWEPLPE